MLQNYSYRARNKSNQVVAGIVQAASIEAARKILAKNELTPITVSVPRSFTEFLPFFNKVALKEKTFFARQLSTMIEAGLTLSQALRLLIRQTKKGKFRSVLEAILNDLQDGFSFSTALAKFPDVFDQIFINVVRSGEATGKLEIVLTQLATNMEKDVRVRGKIKGALVYPAFIVVVMIGVFIIMVTQVIPQLKDVFISSGKALPLSTQFLLKVSDFFVTKWYVVLIIVPILIIALRYFLRSQIGIELVSKYSLKVPFVGKIIEESSMARLGRLLGILLSSGVPLLEALRLITESFPNKLYQRAVMDVAAQVERGVPMSVPINENTVFPLMVGQMVSVGEQTGKMDEVMGRLAGYYEAEVDTKVGSISTLVEPVVIILLGIGVAFLVTSILLPIYEISTSVS